MIIPKIIRKQLKFYESKGFHAVEIHSRSGSHYLLKFAEFPEPQFITSNSVDDHAWNNNVARYRRLEIKHKEIIRMVLNEILSCAIIHSTHQSVKGRTRNAR